MFAILVYDVSKKRDRKLYKACAKYLCHVQESVWEGNITEKRLTELKENIKKVIDVRTDSVRIYLLPSSGMACIDEIGNNVMQDFIV